MDTSRFGSLSPNVEDRRSQPLTIPELMSALGIGGEQQNSPTLPEAPPAISPLAVQAGMLDIVPGHGKWLLKRAMEAQAMRSK